jgi:DNA polymerase-3 subunit epsilon
MRGCARRYRIKPPKMEFLCTLMIARAVWPELKSKALNNVARHLGIAFKHHNAAEDANACAQVAIAAALKLGALEIADIPARLKARNAA